MDVSGIADAPSLEGVDVAGIEDTAIPLNIGIEFVDSDGSESLSVAIGGGDEDSTIPLDIGVALADADGSESITNITISGVPAGAQLSAGTDNGDGTWTLLPGNLPGLTIDPLADSADDFVLTVSATSTDTDGDSATTVSTLNVTVTGVADVPTVTVADAAGAEDSAIQLDIGVALNDIDGSETITDITVSGVPSGARLSAGTRQSGRHLDIDSGPAGGADHHPAG